MKILHVTPSYIPAWQYGGPIRSISEVCKTVVLQGIEVVVLTTNVNVFNELSVPLNESVFIDGVKVKYFQVQRPRYYTFSWPLSRALKNEVKKFDIVHIHGIFHWPMASASFYCRKYKIPYVVSPRGMLDPTCLKHGAMKKYIYSLIFERRNLNGAAAIHFTAEEEKQQAVHFGLKVPNFVVPNGIELKEFSLLPPKGKFSEKHPETIGKQIILFLGRLNWKKGLDLLSQAFSILAEKRNDVHLVVAGPDEDNYKSKIRNWISEEKVINNVTFTGMLVGQDKLEVLVDADIFCLPSYQENFGMAVVEAMACGLPIVISDQINIHKDITEAEAGIVVPCDTKGIALALLKLIENEGIGKEMGERGRRLVMKKYSQDKVAKQMVEIYEKILRGEGLESEE